MPREDQQRLALERFEVALVELLTVHGE